MKWLLLVVLGCGKAGQPEVFATLPTNEVVASLTVLGNAIYAKGDHALIAVDLTSHQVRTVATLPYGLIAAQGDHLLLATDHGEVERIDPTTGAIAMLGKLEAGASSLLVNGNAAYVGANHEIEVIDDGGTRVVSELGFDAVELAFASNRLYVASPLEPKVMVIQSGKVLDATPAQVSPKRLLAVGDRLYWTVGDGNHPDQHLVMMVGGAPRVIADADIAALAADGSGVAIATSDQIYAVSDKLVPIAPAHATALAVHAGVVYWVDENKLRSVPLAKP